MRRLVVVLALFLVAAASSPSGGDPATWSCAVAVMSQEGYPSTGVRRIRDVETSPEQWRIGGGNGSTNGTRIMDLLAIEPGKQESMLSGFTPISTGTVDDLADDDFAQIDPLAAP